MIDHDVLGPEVERYLRETFAGDATHAPLPDALSDGAVRRARAHRRRAAIAGSALALVLVAVGVAVVQQAVPTAEPTPPGATHDDAPLVPSGQAFPFEPPVLMFRGVEVPVPASMLAPENVHCGTPVADAAYVRDDALPVRDCAMAEPPGLTLVVMQPLEDVRQADRKPGGRTLEDGRYQVASAIPGRDVWLTVTSPDPDRADRLFGGAVIADDPRGCPIHPDPSPAMSGGGAIIVAPMSGGTVGQVCGYRSGWLTGAALVSGAELTDLAELVAAAPSDALLDCATDTRTGTGWWIVLGDTRVWVEGGSCPRVIAASGRSGMLTDSLVTRLWQLAAGPGTLTGVVSEKD